VRPEVVPELPTLDLRELERAALVQAMRLAGGRISMAAKLCGVTRCTMRRRLVRHGFKIEGMATRLKAGGERRSEVMRQGARRCVKCSNVRTIIEMRNWPCSCGRSEVAMQGVARWPTGQRSDTNPTSCRWLEGAQNDELAAQ
jgi:hypothetical protein